MTVSRVKISFRKKLALKKILKNNPGKITLMKGPLGHYWFDADENTAFEDLNLPSDFTYHQRLYSDNGGGQYTILDEKEEQVGRINTYTGKK